MEAALLAALLVIDNVLSHEGPPPPHEAPILRRLDEGLMSADQLLRVAAAVDAVRLDSVNAKFIDATLRFAQAARSATGFPAQAFQFDSPIGIVSIGSAGDDRHR